MDRTSGSWNVLNLKIAAFDTVSNDCGDLIPQMRNMLCDHVSRCFSKRIVGSEEFGIAGELLELDFDEPIYPSAKTLLGGFILFDKAIKRIRDPSQPATGDQILNIRFAAKMTVHVRVAHS